MVKNHTRATHIYDFISDMCFTCNLYYPSTPHLQTRPRDMDFQTDHFLCIQVLPLSVSWQKTLQLGKTRLKFHLKLAVI